MEVKAENFKKLVDEGVFEKYRRFLRPSYADFYKKIAYEFQDPSNLVISFTHSSFSYEQIGKALIHNERMEFLGDAILEFIVSTYLFHYQPRLNEGKMTSLRSITVREETLALAATNINLGEYLLLGRGEALNGGRDKPSNLANAFEALLAAIYLDYTDSNPDKKVNEIIALPKKVYNICISLLEPYLLQAISGNLVYDYKSKLLERIQEKYDLSALKFELASQAGPAHCPHFTVEIKLLDKVIGKGSGKSKKEAEQNAAKEALEVNL